MLARAYDPKSLRRVVLMLMALLGIGLTASSVFAGRSTNQYHPSVPSSLVVNGDFETGSLSPFTTTINSGSGAINTAPGFVHSGTYSARITSNTNANSASGVGGGGSCSGGVRIPISPNTSYTWSGFILVPMTATNFLNSRVRVVWYASPNCSGGSQLSIVDSNVITSTTGTWIRVTGTATSPATAAFAEVRMLASAAGAGSSTTVYFDDISMDAVLPTETPTPTATHTPCPDCPTSTVTDTPTNTASVTNTPTNTPTFTPTLSPTPTATNPPSNSVVISEFRTRGQGGGNDEFIELYNKTSSPIDMSGWKINGSSSCGTTVAIRLVITNGVILPAYSHFLATNSQAYVGTVTGDATYPTGISDDGGIGLLDANDILIDAAGMCIATTFHEGTPLTRMTNNVDQSYERYLGGSAGNAVDTNNNANDFFLNPNSSNPQNLSSAPVPPCQLGTASNSIQDFSFNPQSMTINQGTTVIWTNQGSAVHTSTSDVSSSEQWDSGALSHGETFSHTFNNPGTFTYHCGIHPSMTAFINVIAGCGPAPTNTPALPSSTPTITPGGPTLTLTSTPTTTDTPTITNTQTNTSTPTDTATMTLRPTDTPTSTTTYTPTPTNTPTSCPCTNTPTYTFTLTPTSIPTDTPSPTITPPATCGPNSNYVIAAGTATIVPGTVDIGNHCDDCTTNITLPFTYYLYDLPSNTAIVGSNGTLGFIANLNSASSSCLPVATIDYLIAPHYDDLDTRTNTCSMCGIFISTSGVAPNRIFTVEWRASYFGLGGFANFEVRLFEGRDRFDLIYGRIDQSGLGATVGVQRDTGSQFTQFECNFGGITQGLVLSFFQPSCETATPMPTATSTNINAFAHLEPSGPITVTAGTTFTLDLMVNSGFNNVTVQQSYLTFTNSILQNAQVGASSCAPTSTITADTTTFEAALQNEVCNGPDQCIFRGLPTNPGSIAFASGALSNPPAQGDFRVGQVAFCANNVGDAVIHWEFSPPAPSNRDSEIQDENTNIVSNRALYSDYLVHVVAPVYLVGHVTWQGRPAQPNGLQQLPITLTLKMGANEINYSSQTTSASGYFTVPVNGLANGTYSWRARGPRFLANSGTISLIGAPVTNVEMGLMRAGDANNDNLVSATDFNILRGTFGKSSGDPGYDARADFNGDNVVNTSDFNLIRSNFGLPGAPPIGMGGP